MKGVLAVVGAAAGVEFLAQGYPSNVQAWVLAKSNGLSPVYQYPTKGFGTRALGFGVVGVALSFADDGEYAPLAEAFAAVFLVAVILLSGPQAFTNLGAMFNINTGATIAVGKPSEGQSFQSAPSATTSAPTGVLL